MITRIQAVFLYSITFLLLCPLGIKAEEDSLFIDGWTSFPPGSWRTWTETNTRRGETKTYLTRAYFQGIEDGKIITHRQSMRDGEWKTSSTTKQNPPENWLKDWTIVGKPIEEMITLDAKEYVCLKTTYQLSNPREANAKSTLIIWSVDNIKLPYREPIGITGAPNLSSLPTNAVRVKSKLSRSNKDSIYLVETDRKITSLKVEIEIESKKHLCVKEEWIIRRETHGRLSKGEGYFLFSHEIPGHMAGIHLEYTEGEEVKFLGGKPNSFGLGTSQ
ncbi:MAG: hypothetical protein COA78_14210 [Blastopirellula sp.]|nr:MAG: hypothetical protein COA78_14210 [Blastopirellula sp.]